MNGRYPTHGQPLLNMISPPMTSQNSCFWNVSGIITFVAVKDLIWTARPSFDGFAFEWTGRRKPVQNACLPPQAGSDGLFQGQLL